MSQCGCFEQTLHYVSPSHGGWGVVRIAALVPESHHLLCVPLPAAVIRRWAAR